MLWQDGQLTGVVDWPNAAMAPRGIDVGHCLLNLAVLFSSWTDDYLAAYDDAAGVDVEVNAALRSVLNFDEHWPDFIPRQVDGRTRLDLPGMTGRVTELVRRLLVRAG